MFFSYSSSSITLIDIVLLEQRRRNRDSRVRGEKGGGETEREEERKVEEEGGKSRRRGLWIEKWFWWHRLEGQHSQKQRAGANGPGLSQDGHGLQSASSLQVPLSWHGQRPWLGMAQPGPTTPEVSWQGMSLSKNLWYRTAPWQLAHVAWAQALGSSPWKHNALLKLGHGRGSASPGSADS